MGEGVAIIIALHNNTEAEYSVSSYAAGGPLEKEAAAVAIATNADDKSPRDPDDFFFVTDRRLFDALAARNWNVVLQDNERATDDGSLSVLCGMKGIPYINVEAQHEHRDVQESMLNAALDVVDELQTSGVGTGLSQDTESSEQQLVAEEDVELVDLSTFDPTFVIDARYATTENITGRPMYPGKTLYLERGAAEHLKRVQTSLRKQGLRLKILDAYRPLSVQKKLWQVMPDPRYVADPAKGSRHNRGSAVDVTLVDQSGRELQMPTAFDEFSEKAHRDFQDLPAEAIRNRTLLEKAMVAEGFEPLPTEWWHFDAPDWRRFPVMDRNPYQEQATP
jgi:D-alanyl-D-alanine dipeptidase